jgi:hypothetical protein
MGTEERTIGSFSKDFRLSKDSAQRVQLYPHGEWDEPPYPCSGKGCLTFSNIFLIRPECPWKVRMVSWVRLPPSSQFLGSDFHHLPGTNHLPGANHPCQFNGQTNRNQLLGLPPPFVTCDLYGWLLGLTIPMNDP